MFRGIETQEHGSYSSILYILFSFHILHVNIKICVRVFIESVEVRILKLCQPVAMLDYEPDSLLLFFQILSIFFLFRLNLCHIFSGTVQAEIFKQGIHM